MKNKLTVIDNNLIKSKIILIQDKPVLLDRDVAEIYGVETKEVNQAVKNNPKKFPDGSILELTALEVNSLRSKILTLENGRGEHNKYGAKAFTEKALYMLATILKGDRAIAMTLQIIDTFTALREIQTTIRDANIAETQREKTKLLDKSGKLLTTLLKHDLEIDKINAETTVELNLGFLKLSQKTSWFTKKKDK
jgi:phage regulator Rha-like protein